MEFKTFGKKAVSVGLSCALLASTSLTAFAAGTSDVTLQVKGNSDTEPPEIVNIRIPAEIPLTMDEEGAITVGDGLYIENLSDTTGVTVSGISVTGKNGWNVVDFDTDLSGEAENTQKLSMSFNGDGTKDGGAVTLTPDAWDIGKSEQLALTVGAKMPKQNEDSYATKASIATVNYSFSANSTTEPGGGEDPIPDKGQITNNWDSQKALLSTGAREVTFSWDSTDESASITEVKSEDEGVATVQKASTFAASNSMDYSGSENWTVTAVGKGKTTVTATLSSGETTQFDVEVYELTSGGSDVTVDDSNVTGGDTLEPGTDLGDGNHDITIDIPITTPDGEDTITVTPEFPEDTVLEEGENNIEVDVVVDGVTLHITITINIEGSNPSNGLIQSVQEAQAMGFTFSSYEDGLQIDSFENKQFKSEINVPEQIGDFKVLKIGDNAFKGQSNLKKITIPDSVTAIGASAFSDCSGIISMVLDEGLTTIGDNAFLNCSNLSELELNSALTTIGANAFKNCVKLSGELVFSDNLSSIGANAFNGCGLIEKISIPNSVKYLGTCAFSDFGSDIDNSTLVVNCNITDVSDYGESPFYNTTVDNIIIGSGCNSIGEQSFSGISAKSIVIEEGCETIGELAFHNGSAETLNIPSSVTDIGDMAFGSMRVNTVTVKCPIPDKSSDYNHGYEYGVFKKSIFDNVNLEGSCTHIGDLAFYESTIKNLNLPENLKYIGDEAFRNAGGFTELRLPESVTYIGNEAFYAHADLTTVDIPKNVRFGTDVFCDCKKIKSVALSDGLTSIGEGTFASCTGLSGLQIPSSVTTIGDRAFYNVPHIYYTGTASGSPWGALAIN